MYSLDNLLNIVRNFVSRRTLKKKTKTKPENIQQVQQQENR